jgi:protein-disulfide isomerase
VFLFAQDWTTVTSWPTVDLSGLTAPQKATVLKIMREQGCSCGCGMRIAECRTKDPSCTYSRGLASVIVDALRHGKNEKDAWAAAAASQYAKGPAQHNELLETAVKVPVADAPARGPADARVTLVEFSDFQCPFCITATPQLESVLKAYPSQVKLVFKEFPLDSHSQAALAAAAALAARNQGKFWQMYDRLFAQEGHLSRRGILGLASAAGMDMKRFQSDLDSAEVKKAVDKDISDGEHIGVDSTPTLFMNGRRYNGPITLASLKPVIEGELKHPGTAPKTAAR